MTAAALQFDADSHTYRVGGTVYPSVSEILSRIVDFSHVRDDVLERASRRGTLVHSACEYDDAGDLDEDDLDPAIRPYLDAWRKWREDTDAEILAVECRLHHPAIGYAGTIDRVARIVDDVYVIDIKTTCTLYPHVGVQLAAYRMLTQVGDVPRATRAAAVQLRDDGTYRMRPYNDPRDARCFMALLTLQNWIRNHE